MKKYIAYITLLICVLTLSSCIHRDPSSSRGQQIKDRDVTVRANYNVRYYENGMTVWMLGGKLHRDDDAAVIHPNGHREWWINGQRHRMSGPAVIRADGSEEYWLNNVKIANKELWETIIESRSNTTLHGREMVIDGKRYRLELKD